MTIENYALLILLMTLVTYVSRFVPIFLLSKSNMPAWLIKWLKYIPVGVLSALLAPSIFMTDTHLNLSVNNPFLLASIPCFIVAIVRKNILLTILVGIVAYMIFA
ncbi:MAG TPA: AzlD domain-containing protein [Thermotogaceae bacterium]|nr:AzlD domain-containing protein [Thermotogota bacterium]HEW91593.1 AzlD domain-containing protein [Thermotogaceae bacterium]